MKKHFGILMMVVCAVACGLEMPSIFTDHMVLQRAAVIRVWGKAPAGQDVTVTFADNSVTVKAGEDGKWLAKLPPLGPSVEGRDLTVKGDAEITLHDVLVGDVWLCAGQSNMQFPLKDTDGIAPIIESSENNTIRLLQIPCSWSRELKDNVRTSWRQCNPQTVPNFSAVGYLVGRELQDQVKVPVGLIQIAWGGCRVEAMTRLEDFDKVLALKDEAEKVKAEVADINAKKDEELRPDKQRLPTVVYNAMVHPLGPFAVKGMLWYQGEDNYAEGDIYDAKLKALAVSWRRCFANPTMPIYIVLLPPWRYTGEDSSIRLPLFWAAQRRFAESDPYSGFIVTTDLGNPGDIHPRNKIPLASRLAKLVLYKSYGLGNDTSLAPTFKSAECTDSRVIVTFNNPNGLRTRDGQTISFLRLAGEDGRFFPATGVIEGDKLIVSSPNIANPKKIRFGWDKLANPNLVNKVGNPVMPFEEEIK